MCIRRQHTQFVYSGLLGRRIPTPSLTTPEVAFDAFHTIEAEVHGAMIRVTTRC